MDYRARVPDNISLYIFDLDGTLVDSLDDLAASVNVLMNRTGYPEVDRETVRRFVGNGARNLLLRCFTAAAAAAGKEAPDADFVESVLPGYRAYYEAHATEKTRLYPGILEWLESLRARGCRMAVLSNKPVGASANILRALGADGFFDVIAGPETTGTLKPDPSGVLLIMERVGLERDRTVLVGDSEVDIATAKNAGILSCGVTGGIGDDGALRAASPDILIERR